MRAGVDARVDEVHTCLPGNAVPHDPVTNTAVVKPMLKRALYKSDGERVFEELPEIPSVPVVWPRR